MVCNVYKVIRDLLSIHTMHNKLSNFLYFASFCSYLCAILIAMTRTGSKANETTNLQAPSFK